MISVLCRLALLGVIHRCLGGFGFLGSFFALFPSRKKSGLFHFFLFLGLVLGKFRQQSLLLQSGVNKLMKYGLKQGRHRHADKHSHNAKLRADGYGNQHPKSGETHLRAYHLGVYDISL